MPNALVFKYIKHMHLLHTIYYMFIQISVGFSKHELLYLEDIIQKMQRMRIKITFSLSHCRIYKIIAMLMQICFLILATR